jgi:alcohol dehydrogenase class IV
MYFFEFKMPSKIVCVDGGASKLGNTVERLGASKVMVVTDRGVRKAGLVDPVVEGIDRGNAKVVGVFDEVPPDPDVETIVNCARRARELGADGLVSIGGGSSIDTAKGTLIQLCEGGDLLDYEWKEYISSAPLLPHLSIPTTAGTGSEATHVAMVTDLSRNRKLMYQGADLVPRIAVLDPRMTLSLPPSLTASTGMDALTHSIEAMHTTWHQPITDGLATTAIGLVAEFLEWCFKDGGNAFARMNMLMAADLGGIAAGNSFIGIVHATAHPLGGLFHVSHGVAVATMLPYCMEMNLAYDGIPGIYRKVSAALGLKVESDDDITAAKKGIERIRELITNLGLPQNLRDLGVNRSDLDALVDEVMEDKAMLVTPGNPGRDEVAALIERAY